MRSALADRKEIFTVEQFWASRKIRLSPGELARKDIRLEAVSVEEGHSWTSFDRVVLSQYDRALDFVHLVRVNSWAWVIPILPKLAHGPYSHTLE